MAETLFEYLHRRRRTDDLGEMVGKEATMKRYYQLGLVVIKGHCHIAYYDVMSHTVGVMHAPLFNQIQYEEVPEHIITEIKNDWKGKIK